MTENTIDGTNLFPIVAHCIFHLIFSFQVIAALSMSSVHLSKSDKSQNVLSKMKVDLFILSMRTKAFWKGAKLKLLMRLCFAQKVNLVERKNKKTGKNIS